MANENLKIANYLINVFVRYVLPIALLDEETHRYN